MPDPLAALDRSRLSSLALEKRASLIALVGGDGAGKTTQAARLVDWLRDRRQAATLHPNESLQPIKAALNAVAEEMGSGDAEALLGRETSQLAYVAVKWNAMIKLRHLLAQVGLFVVVDRYAYCHVASVRAQRLQSARIVERLFDIFPAPDLTFYLEVTPETAIRRMIQRSPDIPPMSRDYLEAHVRAYRTLEAAAQFVRIDGEPSIDDVQAEIRRIVFQRFSLDTPLEAPLPIRAALSGPPA